jgi:hypothetical protein
MRDVVAMRASPTSLAWAPLNSKRNGLGPTGVTRSGANGAEPISWSSSACPAPSLCLPVT